MKKLAAVILLVASLLTLSVSATNTVEAVPTKSTLVVNGERLSFEAYNIDGTNYFKLRDLASILTNTYSQFDVTWDANKKAINLQKDIPYTSVGGELSLGDGITKSATPSTSEIYVNDILADLTAYTINENNYFNLRDLGKTLNFLVFWDADSATILVDSREDNIYLSDIADGNVRLNQSDEPVTYEIYVDDLGWIPFFKTKDLSIEFYRTNN